MDGCVINYNSSGLQTTEQVSILVKWVVPLTQVVTLISLSFGIILSILQYRLKVKAEIRLKDASIAEVDTKLIKLFTEVMDIAHSRINHIVSDTIIEELFKKNVFNQADFDNLNQLNKKIEEAATLPIPVGAAAQDAAIIAIGNLAVKYDILREPAIVGLETIKTFHPLLTTETIEKIKAVNK